MVGTYRLALVSDVADIVAGSRKLGQTHGQQISELGIRTVVDIVVSFHGQQLSILICRHLHVHECRRSFSGIGNILILIVYQAAGTSIQRQTGHAQKSFHGGTEFVSEGTAGRILYQSEFLRLDSDSCRNHGRMKMDTDTLGVYRQSSFLIDIGETAVRFQMQMGLAAGVSVDLCT